MKRIKHAAVGMLQGWLVLQGLFVMFLLVSSLGGESVRGWHSAADVLRWILIVAFCSAYVCGVAWVVVYLPIYWWWPRSPRWWSAGKVTWFGAVAGAGAVLVINNYQLGGLLVLPAMVGALSAYFGYRQEMREQNKSVRLVAGYKRPVQGGLKYYGR